MENYYYLGIDLDEQNAVISFFQQNMKEPETVSTIAGGERFQIPLLLAKKKGIGQWFIGEEAQKAALQQEENAVRGFLGSAFKHEDVFVEGEKYAVRELLTLFIRKLLLLAGSLGKPMVPDKLVISLEHLSREATKLFIEMAPKLGLAPEQIKLIDRKESFYYFAYTQKEELWLHDVSLFDYREGTVFCRRLQRNMRTKPQLVTLTEECRKMDDSREDEYFCHILQENMKGHIISSVYLIGDGFDGDWMKQSLAFLCKGRRVFIGKNLYSKGACYAAAVSEGRLAWPFVYMGDNEMKVNVSLKVYNCGQLEFYTLISAGDNWYETVGECEVILSGTPEIAFWLQPPNSREAKIEKLELSDLPDRPDKTTRLRIVAKPLSDTKVQMQIKDLGFGELFKSSGKSWEYVMAL